MDTKVDVEDEIDTSKLEFQDFPQDKGKVQTHTFTDFPHTAESDEDDVYDKSELLKEEKTESKVSFWTFEYYQQFFDVESKDVLQRVLGSMFPHPNRNYLKTKIRPNPDLYGPFWICTTLVFTTAIAGNLANYLSIGSSADYNWKYDFHKVSFAATAIFSYWWILPAAIFGFLWWSGNQIGYTFLEILCVYGYSLAIFIPISILWVVQFNWFQWLLVILGTVLSGGVLVFIFLPAVRESTKKYTWALIVIIFLLHASLAVGFKLYFFHIPQQTSAELVPNTTTPQNMKIHPTTLTQKPLANEINSPISKDPDNVLEKKQGGGNKLKDAIKGTEAKNRNLEVIKPTPQKSRTSNTKAKSVPPVKRSSSNNG
ncbi:protein YIPF1-like [Mytilus californianus]|uniref:protein YIPF1-like n=1 Tax=Mytilus californianus TaxID=6549 RepID=UPI0022475ECD|nr:protein YIPF1-like [Mytilus californianus]